MRQLTRGARLAAAVVAAGAFAGLGATLAGGVGGPDDRTQGATSGPAPKIVGVASGGFCKMGYDTEQAPVTPPDDFTADNTPAASVKFVKKCNGSVIALFTSEVSAPNDADYIHLDFRATCLGNGGQTNPCTKGTQVKASPGHTLFDYGPTSFGVRAVQEVWSALPAGNWLFEVLPGGNNSANLQFRELRVDAFQGG
jgi:hypothetical protein